jgi:hypothetical protein
MALTQVPNELLEIDVTTTGTRNTGIGTNALDSASLTGKKAPTMPIAVRIKPLRR